MSKVSRVSLALCGLLLATGAALAQQNPPPAGDKGPACTMTTPRGTLTGTCGAPEGKPLACRPARPPQGQGEGAGKPPPKPAN